MKIKGVKRYPDRHGKPRVYDRSTGKPILSEWGSKEFFAELDAIRGKPRIEHVGTLGAAIRHYEASPLFARLAPRTKSDYKRCLTYLGKIENTPLAVIDKAFAAMLRDKTFNKHGFKFTNYVLTVASLVIGYAQEAGMLSDNPFYRLRRIKKPKTQPDANRPWTTHEFEVAMQLADPTMKAVLVLMGIFAIGKMNALTMPKSALKNSTLTYRRDKTGHPFAFPVSPHLEAIINAAPRGDATTLIVSARGHPFSEHGIRSKWDKLRNQMQTMQGVGNGLTLYGLRHMAATLLREAGYNDRKIADYLGDAEPAMALHYSKTANLSNITAPMVETIHSSINWNTV